MVKKRWKPNGLISPREHWPEVWQQLTDDEAQARRLEILERAAAIPGLDKLFAEGEAVYAEFIEMVTSGQLSHLGREEAS